jgi:hypothetical protein
MEEVVPRNSYMVHSIHGTSLPRAINEKYLKSIILEFVKLFELEDGR